MGEWDWMLEGGIWNSDHDSAIRTQTSHDLLTGHAEAFKRAQENVEENVSGYREEGG
jgi:hypothetical protein